MTNKKTNEKKKWSVTEKNCPEDKIKTKYLLAKWMKEIKRNKLKGNFLFMVLDLQWKGSVNYAVNAVGDFESFN